MPDLATQFFMESTLNDSTLFDSFNNNKTMTIKMSEIVKNGMTVMREQLEEPLLHIKKTRISPLMEAVIDEFDKGGIVLMYSDIISMPAAIPFIVGKIRGVPTGIVFIKRYGSFNRDKTSFNIPPKTLYILMEAAYLAKVYYNNPTRFTRSSALAKISGRVYAMMAMRIMNKEYSLSLDPDLHAQVSYMFARFYLERVLEVGNKDVIHSYAQTISDAPSSLTLNGLREEYDVAGVKNFDDLITFIAGYSKRLTGLRKKIFVQNYMNMYGPASVLGLDCFPYFLFALTSSLMGCFLLNETIIGDILKNTRGLNANLLYPELTKIV